MSSLPAPSPEAFEHSQRLVAHISEAIRQSGGWIPFARYMELALYAPGLGYYSAGSGKFGQGGDFVTAPELSPLFGRSLARQVVQVLEATGGGLLELGAGSGRLALDLLRELQRLGTMPDAYAVLEVSPDLRERQRGLFEREAPELLPRVRWLDALPERFTGLVLGNEVLDALPVHLVHWREDGLFERGVALLQASGEASPVGRASARHAGVGLKPDLPHFVWEDRHLEAGPLFEAASRLEVRAPYLSEVCLAAPVLVTSLAERLDRGALLFLDYGFPRSEYYHPQRSQGTLMCHYRHHAHADPFFLPGLQDITAHVDFTAVAEAGVEAGLAYLGYTSQASFLINCGVAELMQAMPAGDIAYFKQAAAVQKLMSPSEMGELFKVIALGKGMEEPLLGFGRGDRGHAL